MNKYYNLDHIIKFKDRKKYFKLGGVKMSLSWIKGNNEPVSHIEDLLHEALEDLENYNISVEETRLNGKLKNIFVRVNKED